MTAESYINEVLRPKIQGDGGEILVDSRDGDTVTVILRGECSKCPISARCLSWAEGEIARETGEKIRLRPIRRKPYFWDT